MAVVAELDVLARLHDDQLLAGLKNIDDEFERTKRRLEREKMEVKTGVDLRNLNQELKAAEQKVKNYQDRIDATDNKHSQVQLRRFQKLAQAQAEATRKRLVAAQKAAQAQKDENAQLAVTEKLIAAVTKRENDRARLQEAHARKQEALRRRAASEEQRLEVAREKAATRKAREDARAQEALQRELAAIPKLQRRYVELAQSLDRLSVARRKALGDRTATLAVDVKQADIESEMRRINERLSRSGAALTLGVTVAPGRDLGERVRRAIMPNNRSFMATASDIGQGMGRTAGSAFSRTFARISATSMADVRGYALARGGGMLTRGMSRLGGMLSTISSMTVRLGPFTATIRQALGVTALFGPILLDLAGAMGSLVAVTGSATAGLGALGAGLLAGAVPALIGMGTALKPMVADLKHATQLSSAYQKALAEGNEDLAKKKLEALNKVLKGTSQETREAFKTAGTLADSWVRLTAPTRTAAFGVIGAGIQLVNNNMTMLAQRTNAFSAALGGGLERLIRGLDMSAISEAMANVADAVGPVVDGFANLLNYALRVGAVASRSFRGFGNTFRDWSQGLLDTTNNAAQFEGKITRAIDSLRSLGRFLMSGGRLLKTFFSGGVEAGQDFLEVMTRAMDSWREGFETPQGRESLANFFQESVAGARAFYNAIAPLISTFVRWAAALAPIARAFFEGAGAITNFVAEALRLTALQGPITALVSTLGALWAVGKITAATRALAGFTAGLLGLRAAGAAAGAAGILGGAGAGAAAGAAARGAAGATAATIAGGAAAGAAASRFGALRVAAMAARGPILLVGTAAVTAGIYLAGMKSEARETAESLTKGMAGARKAGEDIAASYRGSGDSLAQLNSQQIRATMAVKAAREALKNAKKGTDEYKLAQLDLRDAQRYAAQSTRTLNDYKDEFVTKTDRQVDAVSEELRLFHKRNDGIRQTLEQQKRESAGADERAEATRQLNKLNEQQIGIEKRLEAARNRQSAAVINVKRQMQGLEPVFGRAEQAMGRLARQGNKKLATTIGVKFQGAENAGRVAAQASRALKSGVPKSVTTRIVGDSKNAEQAIKRLQAARLTPKRLEIIEKGGQKAINVLERIVARKLSPKEQRIVERGGDNVFEKLRAIGAKDLPAKTQTIRERGTSEVIGKIGNVIAAALGIRDKSFTVTARDNASGTLGRISSLLGSLASKTINVVLNYLTRGRPPGKATGGVGADSPMANAATRERQMRVVRSVERENAASLARGARIQTPRAIYGEEPAYPEFVISTNPAYRKSNRRYLEQAAKVLGAAVGDSPYGDFGKGGVFNPQAVIKRGKKYVKPKNRKAAISESRSWNRYVLGLQEQQGYWEREVSIRESQVREPEDPIIKGPQKEVDDPLNPGQKIKVDTYVPNTAAIDTFKTDLTNVMQAMQTLIAVVTELVRAIPLAIMASKSERGARQEQVSTLNERIEKHRRKMNKADREDKPKYQKQIDKWEDERDRHKRVIEERRDDEKALVKDRVNAGFDIREYLISYGKVQAERDSAHPDAEAGAREQTEANMPTAPTGGGGGGGGGGGSNPISYGEQAALTDTAKGEILRQFGSNFIPAMNTAGNPTGTGRETLQRMTALGGPSFAPSAAGAAVQQSSRAGAAVARATNVGLGSLNVGGSTRMGAGAPAAGGSPSITVNNTFATVPPDPHSWAKGVEFELGTLV